MTEPNELAQPLQAENNKKEPKKRKRNTELDFLVSKADVVLRVADMMSQQNALFSRDLKYITLKTADGKYLPATVTADGIVSYANETIMFQTIRDYAFRLNVHKFKTKDFILSEADCKETVSKFKGLSEEHGHAYDLKDVRTIRHRGDTFLAFHELSFDLQKNVTLEECPVFSELLSRCSNPTAFVQFIGSIFDFTPINRQQYLWMYGRGMNGKGSLCEALMSVFNQAAHKYVGEQKGQFWLQHAENKMFVFFDEVGNSSFPMSPRFKGMTGGPTIEVERKNKDSYTGTFYGKIIIASNEEISIQKQKSNLRRAIFCTFDDSSDEQNFGYTKKLEDELPKFASYCYREYMKTGCALIKNSADAIETMTESFNLEFDSIFDQLFTQKFLPTGERDENYYLPTLKIFGLVQTHTNFRWKEDKMNKFITYLLGVKGLRRDRKRYGNQGQHQTIFGIALNSNKDSIDWGASE